MANLNLHAQPEPETFYFSAKIGATYSNFTKDVPLTFYYDGSQGGSAFSVNFSDAHSTVGFAIGVDFQYQINKCLGVTVGLNGLEQSYNYKTYDFAFNMGDKGIARFGDDVNLSLNYLAIPVLANIYVCKGLSFNAGIQPEFAIGRNWYSKVSLRNGNNKERIEGQIKDFNSFQFSFPLGVSYEIGWFFADFRYNIGVTDILKRKSKQYPNIRSNVMVFTLGYKCQL